MENLWNLNKDIVIESPAEVLRKQADFLSEMTESEVCASVVEKPNRSNGFSYDFIINSPLLPNYSYKVFSIECAPTLYPLKIACVYDLASELKDAEYFGTNIGVTCNNMSEYKEKIKEILSTDYMSQVVAAVKSMVNTSLPF